VARKIFAGHFDANVAVLLRESLHAELYGNLTKSAKMICVLVYLLLLHVIVFISTFLSTYMHLSSNRRISKFIRM